MAAVSHELEELLDDLRLGRVELGVKVVDTLFRGVELYGLLLLSEKGEAQEPAQAVEEFLAALATLTHRASDDGAGLLPQYELDSNVLGVLTEYEEHRLRTNMKAGVSLYRINVHLALVTIDTVLEDIKAAARPHGEIITYLPSGTGADADHIDLGDPDGEPLPPRSAAGRLPRARRRRRACEAAWVRRSEREVSGAGDHTGCTHPRRRRPERDAGATRSFQHSRGRRRHQVHGIDAAAHRPSPRARDGGARRAKPGPGRFAPLGEPDGAGRHTQARQPDERRRRARHGPRVARANDRASQDRAAAPRVGERAASPAASVRAPPDADAERHPRGAHGPPRPGLREAGAGRTAAVARKRQGGQPRHHGGRDGDRQAHRRGAVRPAHAHDPQRHRPRRRVTRGADQGRQAFGRDGGPERIPEGQPRPHRGGGRRTGHEPRSAARHGDPARPPEAKRGGGALDARDLQSRVPPGLHHQGVGEQPVGARRRDGTS